MKSSVYPLFLVLLLSCTGKPSETKDSIAELSDSISSGYLVADTIIYDVIIRSPNPEDEWEKKRLQYLDHSAFIDSLFDLVYDRKIIAYDVFDNVALSLSQIRSIENQKDYRRERIGKIQFTEKWYFNSADKMLQKEILSVALGYETYDEEGAVRAYKPVFRLYLK